MAVEINISQRQWQDFDRAIHGLPDRPAIERYVFDPLSDLIFHPRNYAIRRFALNALWFSWIPNGWKLPRIGLSVKWVLRGSLIGLVAFNVNARVNPEQSTPIDTQPVPRVSPLVPPVQLPEPSRTPAATMTRQPTSTLYIPVDVTPESRFDRRPVR